MAAKNARTMTVSEADYLYLGNGVEIHFDHD